MPPLSQLFASPLDLDEMGPPIEVLSSKTTAQKIRTLRFASAELASYLRERYALPLRVSLETTTINITGGGTATIIGTPEEALSLSLQVTAGGIVGVDPVMIQVSEDGGRTYEAAIPLASSGVYTYAGLTITFSGLLAPGDTVSILAGLDYSLRGHTVHVAAYKLVYNRGVDPTSREGKELRQLYDDAIAWGKALNQDDARLDGNADATPGKSEVAPRWTAVDSAYAGALDGTFIGDDVP